MVSLHLQVRGGELIACVLACLRREIGSRLAELGISQLYLPHLTTVKPSEPSLPILTTPLEALRDKKRILVVSNDSFQDLGIWAWRMTGTSKGSIDEGSAVNFIKAALANGEDNKSDSPGIVILNPGQLLYSHKKGQAVTHTTWNALPRPSAVHPAARVDETHNRIKGNETPSAHLGFACEHVLNNPDIIASDATFDIIGIGEGGETLLQFLDRDWERCKARVNAVALTHPFYFPFYTENSDFNTFLRERARAWALSDRPLDTLVSTPKSSTTISNNRHDPDGNHIPEAAAARSQTPERGDGQDRIASEAFNWGSTNDICTNAPGWADIQPGFDDDGEEESLSQAPNCPVFSGGTTDFGECVFPHVNGALLKWFDEVRRVGRGYRNPEELGSGDSV